MGRGKKADNGREVSACEYTGQTRADRQTVSHRSVALVYNKCLSHFSFTWSYGKTFSFGLVTVLLKLCVYSRRCSFVINLVVISVDVIESLFLCVIIKLQYFHF